MLYTTLVHVRKKLDVIPPKNKNTCTESVVGESWSREPVSRSAGFCCHVLILTTDLMSIIEVWTGIPPPCGEVIPDLTISPVIRAVRTDALKCWRLIALLLAHKNRTALCVCVLLHYNQLFILHLVLSSVFICCTIFIEFFYCAVIKSYVTANVPHSELNWTEELIKETMQKIALSPCKLCANWQSYIPTIKSDHRNN